MIVKTGLGAAAFAMAMLSNPAQANETATAVQITGAVKADTPATGDAEFRELFASWKQLDGTEGGLTAPRAKVAIPSLMPLEDMTLTSSFGMRNHPILRRRAAHAGVDLAAPSGTPVYATADGYVARAERFSSYGNYIQIEHGGELQTRYAHLSGYAVSSGDRVVKGQLIGYVGTTGRSTGPHLHYEVRVAGEAVDPTPYMTDTETQLALAEGEGGRGGPE